VKAADAHTYAIQTLTARTLLNGKCVLEQDKKGVLVLAFVRQGITITPEGYGETL
jgi:hypothetical protein